MNHPPTDPSLDNQLRRVRKSLHRDFDQQVGHDTVDDCITAALERVADSRFPDFQPLLVDRYARQSIRGLLAGNTVP